MWLLVIHDLVPSCNKLWEIYTHVGCTTKPVTILRLQMSQSNKYKFTNVEIMAQQIGVVWASLVCTYNHSIVDVYISSPRHELSMSLDVSLTLNSNWNFVSSSLSSSTLITNCSTFPSMKQSLFSRLTLPPVWNIPTVLFLGFQWKRIYWVSCSQDKSF